ncbi:MAG: InlB B-repeat-containing protein, partial [Clostridia bacterium]|nr:InlB B-repeat-containing protein [Clostridia bacterium]
MTGKRIISTLLALLMVMGLFAAFPANRAIKVSAATTNLALKAQYRGDDATGVSDGSSYADSATWNTYHSGKLNNGIIGTVPTSTSMTDTIEMVNGTITTLTKGTVSIYFKLDSVSSVSEVSVYANRRDNAYRGFPDTVRVYVGQSETDVSTSTLLGSMAEASASTYNSSSYQKRYSISGTAKTGAYVIIQMDVTATNSSTTAGKGVIALTEVGITGTSTNEAALPNVAKLSTYRGGDNTVDNYDGTWGEVNWNTYHSGKLNDGALSTTYTPGSSDTTKETTNIEMWLKDSAGAEFVGGTGYIYFKLPSNYAVSQVNVYTNIRNGVATRGYPTKLNVYVGDSESDISTGTKLGNSAYSAYNTSVRNYKTSGLKSGTYVIIEVGVDANQMVVGFTEIEIFGVPATEDTFNVARSATYMGGTYTVDNYDGPWGEVDFNVYHTGRLNDGVIASTYTPGSSDTARETTNVEMWLKDSAGNEFVAGNAYIYFKLQTEMLVENVNVYANIRNGVANRGYPTAVNVYVADDINSLSSATKLGDASYTAYNTSVRKYTASGSKMGSYVILELGVNATEVVIALTEVEITGADAATAALTAPVLNSNTATDTYTVPTISWNAVPNADNYDVYLNGALAVSGTTATSYTPAISPYNAYGEGGNRASEQVYVVAKADGLESATSATYSFRYVSKPTDESGNALTSADFLLDAGNDGTVNGDRSEKGDNLRMAIAVGELLREAGFTVAYTRNGDTALSDSTKLAMVNAGSFGSVISFGRASAESGTGCSFLYGSGKTASQALAEAISAEITADAIWTNGGVAVSSASALLGGSTTAVALELGYILNATDNTTYDSYFGETAQAIARGAIKNAGYTVGVTGGFESPASGSFSDSTSASLSAEAGNSGESAVVNVSGWVLSHAGISAVEYSIDGGDWTALTLSDRTDLGSYTYKTKANSGFAGVISTEGLSQGGHTVSLRAVTKWDSTTKYSNTVSLGTVTVAVDDVTDNEYNVTFIGKDGVVIDVQTVVFGAAATAPEVPAVEGFVFAGWDRGFDNVTTNITVNAIYEVQTFTVTFVGYEGAVLSTQTVEYGKGATAPSTEYEGLYFHGWDKSFDAIYADTVVTGDFSIYVIDRGFEITVETGFGIYDPDGAGTSFEEGEYIVVDLFVGNIDVPYQYGISGIDGYLNFDESLLIPVFKTDAELNGTVGSANPGPIYNWPEYDVTVPSIGLTYQLYSVEGLCVPYAYLKDDGTYGNANPSDPEQDYTMGKGYIRFNYIINVDTHVAWNSANKGLYSEDAVQLRYYFLPVDGSIDPGDTFTFTVPDSPEATQVVDAVLRAPYYTGASDNTAFQTAFGKGDTDTLVIPDTPTYTVEFVVDGVVVDTQTVEEGAAATAPADPTKDGYTFTGWDVAFDNITADTTVTALFTVNTYTVEFVVDGTVVDTQTVEHGAAATAPADPTKDGYTFTGWDVAFDNITADTTVTAQFEQNAVAADFFTFAEGADNTYVSIDETKG